MREYSDGSKFKIAAFVGVWILLSGLGIMFVKAQGPTAADLEALEQQRRMYQAAQAAQDAYEMTRPNFDAESFSRSMSQYNGY